MRQGQEILRILPKLMRIRRILWSKSIWIKLKNWKNNYRMEAIQVKSAKLQKNYCKNY